MMGTLPFGQRPQPVVYFYFSPKEETVDLLRQAFDEERRSDNTLQQHNQRQGNELSVQYFSFEALVRYGLEHEAISHATLEGKHSKQQQQQYRRMLAMKQREGWPRWDDAGVGVEARLVFAERYWKLLQTSPATTSSGSDVVVCAKQQRAATARSLLYRPLPPPPYIPFVNFDVTALVALCSDTCNGNAGTLLPGFKILEEQSRQEVAQRSVTDYIDVHLQSYTRTSLHSTAAGGGAAVDVSDGCVVVDSMQQEIEAHLSKVFGSRTVGESRKELSSSMPSTTEPGWTVRRATDFLVPLNDTQRRLLFVDRLVLNGDHHSSEAGPAASSVVGSRFALFSSDCPEGRALDEGSPSSSFHISSQFLQKPTPPLGTTSKPQSNNNNSCVTPPPTYNWVLSDVALSEFLWIMHTIAGPAEYRRALLLLDRMYVVFLDPSQLFPSSSLLTVYGMKRREGAAVHCLNSSTKINARHKGVFGLGDVMHAVTLTANKQFVQAAKDQGVEVCIGFHPSRALTERKRTGADHMGGPKKPPALTICDWGSDRQMW